MLKIDQQISEYKQKIELLEEQKKLTRTRLSEEQIEAITDNMGQRIKTIRESLGIPQFDLARVVQCSYTTISKIEGGAHTPSIPLLLRIVAVLNCKLSDIVSEEDIEHVRLNFGNGEMYPMEGNEKCIRWRGIMFDFVLIQPETFLMGSPETEFDRYWRTTTVMQTAVKEAKRHHKDLTDSKTEDQFKQGYSAALSWLLITLGEDD